MLKSVGVKNKNTREVIRDQTLPDTLPVSDVILKFFFAALNTNLDWAKYSLPKELFNKSMEEVIN